MCHVPRGRSGRSSPAGSRDPPRIAATPATRPPASPSSGGCSVQPISANGPTPAASSAAYGLTSMPLTLAGLTSGNVRSTPSVSASICTRWFEVLDRLQRQVEEVPRAAGWIEYRELAQPGQERPVPTLGVVAPFHPRGARPGGFRAFQLGCDRRLLPLPLGEQRPDHDRLDELQDLLAVRVVRPEAARACPGRGRARTASRGSTGRSPTSRGPLPRAPSRCRTSRAAAPRRRRTARTRASG